MFTRILKTCLVSGIATLLLGCGGGSDTLGPSVSEIKAQAPLSYGQKATLVIAGKYMRSDMVADTGSCTNPSFSTQSSPDVVALSCNVTAVGALPIAIKAADGTVLYSTTLTVPLPQVTVLTSKGVIVLELNPSAAPKTVNNFLTYVSNGYYKGTLFHRVIAGFVVQGGGYTTGMVKKDGQRAPIALESNNGLTNTRSTLAMARTSDANSATSEFFVNLADNTSLDYQNVNSPGYAVFGKVVSGMDVVDAIAAVPTGSVGGVTDIPTTDVTVSLAFQSK